VDITPSDQLVGTARDADGRATETIVMGISNVKVVWNASVELALRAGEVTAQKKSAGEEGGGEPSSENTADAGIIRVQYGRAMN
jgi:hypothetical protein